MDAWGSSMIKGNISGRIRGCNAAALSTNESVLMQAIRIGNRATRRVARRNLQKLMGTAPPTASHNP